MTLELRNVDRLCLSLFDKEATYDAGPAGWLAANACEMSGFEDGIPEYDDEIVNDKEGVSGSEYLTYQEIAKKGVKLAYTSPRLKPNELAGLASLHFGSSTPAQDGALVAYRHLIKPVAAGVALPSIGALAINAGSQYKFTGLKSDSFELKFNGRYFSVVSNMLGSGTRASDATSFPAKISENWLNKGYIAGAWLETGTNITITDPPTQGVENISSATPDSLVGRLVDFNFKHNNNLRGDLGYAAGGGLVRSDLEYGRRSGEVLMKVKALSTQWATELAYYEDQVECAMQISCKMTDLGVIAATGTYYYGFELIIPLLFLKPIAREVEDDYHVITFAGEIAEDGTNDEVILAVYNAQVAYIA